MHPSKEAILTETRRQFFARGGQWLGALALASLVAEEAKGSPKGAEDERYAVCRGFTLPGPEDA